MSAATRELKFTATVEKGEVSAILAVPSDARVLLVLGHGAGTDMRHRFMQELSDALNDAKIATFRFNYPYSEKGGGMDGEKVRLATVRAAIETAMRGADGLAMFAGGHSMSGRMVSTACAREPISGLEGDRVLRLSAAFGQTEYGTRRASEGRGNAHAVSVGAAGQDGGSGIAAAGHRRSGKRDPARRGYGGSWIQGAEAAEYRRTRHGGTGPNRGRVDVWVMVIGMGRSSSELGDCAVVLLTKGVYFVSDPEVSYRPGLREPPPNPPVFRPLDSTPPFRTLLSCISPASVETVVRDREQGKRVQ